MTDGKWGLNGFRIILRFLGRRTGWEGVLQIEMEHIQRKRRRKKVRGLVEKVEKIWVESWACEV